MATTVGRWALRVPTSGDDPDIPADFLRLATDLSNVAMADQGVLSARPPSTAMAPSNKPGLLWMTKDAGSATQDSRLWWDNGSGYDEIPIPLVVTATWDPPSIAAGDYAFVAVTATGARLGDICRASFTPYPGAHVIVAAQVSASDQVVVTLHNARLTGATDPASGTVRVAVFRT